MPKHTHATKSTGSPAEFGCPQCGAKFIKTRPNRSFCSDKCRQESWLVKRKAARSPGGKPFICEECGAEIERRRAQGRFPRFCGIGCRKDRDKRLRREARQALNLHCYYCGEMLNAERADMRYCDERCARTAAARRRGQRPINPPEMRLAQNLVENTLTGCWEWQGAKLASGYGSMSVNNKSRVVHRYVWRIVMGPIPHGLQIDHVCRNRVCVNPAHLDAVTQQENLRRSRMSAEEQMTFAKEQTMTLADLVALLTGSRDHLEESRRE